MNIAGLIKEAKQGGYAAQRCLFDAFAPRMLMVCRRYVKNLVDAEERLQDGFCKFFQTLSSFEYYGDAALYKWLKTIMINECLMSLRKKANFTLVDESEAEDLPLPEDIFGKMSADELTKILLQLPLGYRTVFNLYVMEEMTHLEIAELLNITEGSSKSQLAKAKKMIRKRLPLNEQEYVQSGK